MKTGGERQRAPQTDAPRGVAEWAFGGNVYGIGPRAFDSPLDITRRDQRQADFRIARHRQRPELVGTEDLKLRAKRARFPRDVPQSAHDAVDLRMPGIGGDQDFQDFPALLPHGEERRETARLEP